MYMYTDVILSDREGYKKILLLNRYFNYAAIKLKAKSRPA